MVNKPSKAKKSDYTSVIEASKGTIIDISRRLGLTAGAVMRYFEAHPDIEQLYQKKRLERIDLAEDVAADLLIFEDDENPTQAAGIRLRESQYVRGRLGKNRGWTEKTETEITGQINSDVSLIKICEELIDEDKISTSSKDSCKK